MRVGDLTAANSVFQLSSLKHLVLIILLLSPVHQVLPQYLNSPMAGRLAKLQIGYHLGSNQIKHQFAHHH